jgi:hypothetical protein
LNLITTATNAASRYLEVGGAHSLFREIALMTQNGTLIQRYERYNRWYAMMSMATHSPQHVELVEAAAGDSVSGIANVYSPYRASLTTTANVQQLTYTRANVSFDDGTRQLRLGITTYLVAVLMILLLVTFIILF